MDWNNKVLWSEGMLLQHQHLQQHDRYWHHYIEACRGTLRQHGWGYSRLLVDEQQLALGKLGLLECAGIMPDGTPLAMPMDTELPLPLTVPAGTRDTMVVLALPLRRPGICDVVVDGEPSHIDYARYRMVDCTVFDSTAPGDPGACVQVGKLRPRLALAGDVGEGYAVMGVARIIERRADNGIVLDRDYCPPCVDYRAAAPLAAFVDEVVGLLHQRGEALAGRLLRPGAEGAAEMADFLLLQIVNRCEPLFAHLASAHSVHPETLFRHVLQLAGELATFTHAGKRPAAPPAYRHDALQDTYGPLKEALRRALRAVMDPHAISIPLEEGQFGLRIGRVPDAALFNSAGFVLAVKADMAAEALWAALPDQIKIGPVERIHDLVSLQLPGIGLRPLTVAPRQLPFHVGRCYFALDAGDALWPQLAVSAGVALHVAGEVPGLDMELWAIRQ